MARLAENESVVKVRTVQAEAEAQSIAWLQLELDHALSAGVAAGPVRRPLTGVVSAAASASPAKRLTAFMSSLKTNERPRE